MKLHVGNNWEAMIKISIVTITYNAARSLQRTLDSVSNQSYKYIEHLIIDGASKDDTVKIAERYQRDRDYEVVIQSEPDKGLYDAMNKGLQKATGDYIVFLNAGDSLYAEDTIERVATCAESSPAVIYGDTATTDAEGNFLRLRRHRPPKTLTWRSFKKGMLVCHQAFYVKLDIAKKFPYNLKYKHSADVDWCIRIMKEADRCGMSLVNSHAILANFEEGGDTTQNHQASLVERFNVMADHYGWIQTFLLHCWFVVRAVFKR